MSSRNGSATKDGYKFNNMDLQVSLKKILKKGSLDTELEFQRATIIDRQLRLLVKKNPSLTEERKRLRSILKAYEDKYWIEEEINDEKVLESEFAEHIAELENSFNLNRKQVIRSVLKEKGLTQKELGRLLGHTSETHMSELMNGVNPFTLSDLIVIHKLLNIGLDQLIPTTLSIQIINRLLTVISELKNPKLQYQMENLVA